MHGSLFAGSDLTNGVAVSYGMDGVLGVMSNPDRFGIYGESGGGYRKLSLGAANSTFGSLEGGELLFGLGVHAKVGSFRFVPKVDVFLGWFGASMHAFLTCGVSSYWEVPLPR